MGRWWSAIVLTATAVVVLVLSFAGANAPAKANETSIDPVASCAGNQVTFVNNNSYPVWLGEAVQGGSQVIAPSNGANDWQIAPSSSMQMCLPSGWSGNFWARTGCQFDTLYASDPNYKTCFSDNECSSGHICWAGQCLISGCTTNADCQSQLGNNPSAQCQKFTPPTPTGSPSPTVVPTPFSVCVVPLACQTGDCGGASQCYGTWDGVALNVGGAPPVSLFEPTSNSATNVNYDVSLVSGYNTSIAVAPSVSATGANCYAPACVTDLNTVCPANLQVLASPTASPSTSIPCGSGYCASGVCQNSMCVIGCNQPGIQCQTSGPAGLMCGSPVAAPSATPSPAWSPDGSAYEDMYSAKNLSGFVDPIAADIGISMASGLQGTALCWDDLECLSGQTCDLGVLPAGYPTTIGICSGQAPATNCQTTQDIGNQCGNYFSAGFNNALGYTCVALGGPDNGQVACVPPNTAGLGAGPNSASGQADLYAGAAGLSNPEWMAAAMQAGNGIEPYFETFSKACPREYAWQYDDYAGGLDCDSGGQTVNFTVTFGPTTSASPTATPTGTATATPNGTTTPTPVSTPTLTIGGSQIVAGSPPTLPFPAVAAGRTAYAKFKVVNTGNTVTGFNLSTALSGSNPGDFRVRRSGCTTSGVRRNRTCTYRMAETPQNPPESATLTITAVPRNGGQNQVLILDLVGGS